MALHLSQTAQFSPIGTRLTIFASRWPPMLLLLLLGEAFGGGQQ
jgi:hypothetical protein